MPASLPILPLFPLRTVLFPGGLLPLRIFEVRYLDMIARCHEAGTPFGVVGLTDGAEVRLPGRSNETFHRVGTLAHIESLTRPQQGLMMIRCVGRSRFRLRASEQTPQGLWVGHADLIDDDLDVAVPDDLAAWKGRLSEWIGVIERRVADPDQRPLLPPYRFDDCAWLANRFCELLPIGSDEKQNLMALENPLVRLELVVDVLERMDETRQAGTQDGS